MRYKLLGRSGLRVSELCLGAMTFGEEWGWGASEAESRRMFDAFLDAGGNFIDTANVYTQGTSERFLGDFMTGKRARTVLATKFTNTLETGDPNAGGNQRKNMMQAVEASLRRLKTDYIDLYWLHVWDALTPIEEVMRAFDDLVRQGKVLYVGVSDAPAWVVARANTLAELRGWSAFVALQIEYSLMQRTPDRELLPMARALGLTVTPWGVLAGGLLTGKYGADARQTEPRRFDSPMFASRARLDDHRRTIADAVQAVARALGRSPSQVALAWVRHQPGEIIPILGTRRMAQLEDNLDCLNLTLSADHLEKLDEVSRIELGFPHEFYRTEMVDRLVYGGLRSRIDDRGVPAA